MDAVAKSCNMGMLAAGAAAAKGKRGNIRSRTTAAAINIKPIGAGVAAFAGISGISKSFANFNSNSNSSSWLRFSSATSTNNNTNVLPLLRSVPPPPPPAPFSSSISAEAISPVQAHEENLVSPIQTPTSQTKTAHVKFVLQRACMFGEQFFLVGDDPMFGLWDPCNAIPMEWSDGHLWTARMDIPVGRSIQFKFLLRGLSGEVHWQPGPDRIIRIWETENAIVVSEDWDNAESQKITEEVLGETATAALMQDEEAASNCAPATDEPAPAIVAADSTKLPQSLDCETKFSASEANPLLVAGIDPIPVSATSSVFSQIANGNAVDPRLAAADVVVDSNSSQFCLGQSDAKAQLPKQAKTGGSNTDLLVEDMIALFKKPIGSDVNAMVSCCRMQTEDEVYENESSQSAGGTALQNHLKWGLKALNQLILNLGFSINLPVD